MTTTVFGLGWAARIDSQPVFSLEDAQKTQREAQSTTECRTPPSAHAPRNLAKIRLHAIATYEVGRLNRAGVVGMRWAYRREVKVGAPTYREGGPEACCCCANVKIARRAYGQAVIETAAPPGSRSCSPVFRRSPSVYTRNSLTKYLYGRTHLGTATTTSKIKLKCEFK